MGKGYTPVPIFRARPPVSYLTPAAAGAFAVGSGMKYSLAG